MDWRISFDNDVVGERYDRSMAETAHLAAEICEADGTRVSAVAARKTPIDDWYEENVTFSEWTDLLRIFEDTEHAIYLILDSLCDSYLEPVYYAENLQMLSPDITDAIPPEEWEEEDPAEVLRDLDERLQLLSQDTAELDPAELWKGFGI